MNPITNRRLLKERVLVSAIGLLAVLLAGCQSVSPGWRDDVRKSIDKELDDASGKSKPPVDVSKALLPPLEIRLPDGQSAAIEPRFDLAVSNAPARQVFMGLVEGTRYSMVVHPDVSGAISLNLKNVTVPDAMTAVRTVYGYEFRRDGDRFFVLGREMQTRLFSVNYLNLVRKGKSDTRVTASGLSSTEATAGSRTTTSTTQSGVQVETKSQSEFWKDLEKMLTALVGNEGGRKVILNAQTGIIAVRAMPDELRLVEEYLGATHATVNRQVILEAKILEVRLSDGFQAGINWARIGSSYVTSQVGGGTIFSSESGFTSGTAGNSSNLFPSVDRSIGSDVSAFGGIFSIAGGSDSFQAFVELLKGQGEVQVLSSPRVSTVNNQKAVIKVGTDEFFVTKQETTPATVIGAVPSVTTELAPFFSGIALDVTPQIDESGNINLHIHPSVSDVTGKTIPIGRFETGDGSKFTQEISTARSSVQESDSIVRAASGQIIVIGGLMKEGSTDKNASVPFVGDVPIVGNLFKQTQVSRVKRELVILLKATVIEANEQWGDIVSESRRRIDNIKPGQ